MEMTIFETLKLNIYFFWNIKINLIFVACIINLQVFPKEEYGPFKSASYKPYFFPFISISFSIRLSDRHPLLGEWIIPPKENNLSTGADEANTVL